MTSLERYYSNHLRSVFISKFRYFDARTLKIIGGMRWVFIAKPHYFSMLTLLCFYTTGSWPTHRRLRRRLRGGRFAASLLGVSVTYSVSFARRGLQLLQKCKFFHFPSIDSGTFASDFLFEMVFVNQSVLYSNWHQIVPTLLELEGILEGQLVYAQRCAKSIFLRCYFKTPPGRSLYYLQTAVRALQIPLVGSSRFNKSLLNSGVSFANVLG